MKKEIQITLFLTLRAFPDVLLDVFWIIFMNNIRTRENDVIIRGKTALVSMKNKIDYNFSTNPPTVTPPNAYDEKCK